MQYTSLSSAKRGGEESVLGITSIDVLLMCCHCVANLLLMCCACVANVSQVV